MSQLDVIEAKRALAIRLRMWGITEDEYDKASGFIDDLLGRGWVMDPLRESRPQPPRKNQVCLTCQKHLDHCLCGERRTQPPTPGDAATWVNTIRQRLRGGAEEEA